MLRELSITLVFLTQREFIHNEMADQYFGEEWFVMQQKKLFTIKDNMIIGNPPSCGSANDSIAKIILDSFDKDPDFICQINAHTGEEITFAEMKDLSIRCAVWLKKQGIGKDDVIVIATPNQTDDYVPFLATLYVNAIYNPWYHELTPVLAKRFFEMLQPKMMFVCEQSVDMLADVAKGLGSACKFVVYGKHERFPSLRDLLTQQSQAEVENFHHTEPIEPKKQVGVIYFSSGTTGIPKGTMLSYETMVRSRVQYSLIHRGMRMLWYSNMSWITGSNFFLACIRMRTTRICHADFDTWETSEIMEKYKINWAFLTPSMLTQMVQGKGFGRRNLSTIEVMMIGGSKPNKPTLEEAQKALPRAIITNGYGMTELGGIATRQTRNSKTTISIGHIVEDITMKVIDLQTGKLLGPNQSGELCFKLENPMLGYFKNPQATKEMIDNEGWVHTGDLGYYDDEGEITITDRIKQVIITQNHHVSPAEIEEILLQHSEVADVSVVSVPHEIDIERPLAFVVRVRGAKVTAKELKDLPIIYNEYFRLSGGVIFIDELPYTSTGKINIKELKEMAKDYAQQLSS